MSSLQSDTLNIIQMRCLNCLHIRYSVCELIKSNYDLIRVLSLKDTPQAFECLNSFASYFIIKENIYNCMYH